jgi:hypothetical protein
VQKLAGVIWVDEKARDVARLEAYFVGDFRFAGGLLANLQKGTSFIFEQAYVNNEVWLPTYEEAHVGVRVLLLKGFKVNAVTRYSNYKRFNVETLSTIAKPKGAEETAPTNQFPATCSAAAIIATHHGFLHSDCAAPCGVGPPSASRLNRSPHQLLVGCQSGSIALQSGALSVQLIFFAVCRLRSHGVFGAAGCFCADDANRTRRGCPAASALPAWSTDTCALPPAESSPRGSANRESPKRMANSPRTLSQKFTSSQHLSRALKK